MSYRNTLNQVSGGVALNQHPDRSQRHAALLQHSIPGHGPAARVQYRTQARGFAGRHYGGIQHSSPGPGVGYMGPGYAGWHGSMPPGFEYGMEFEHTWRGIAGGRRGGGGGAGGKRKRHRGASGVRRRGYAKGQIYGMVLPGRKYGAFAGKKKACCSGCASGSGCGGGHEH